MAMSAVEICSAALLKLGAASIRSFTEGSVEADTASALYGPTRDSLLGCHPWSFANDGKANEADFPNHFTCALINRLAAEFCLPLTENTARAELLFTLANTELKLSKLIDDQPEARSGRGQ